MYAAYQLGRRMDYLRFKKYDERVFSCIQKMCCTWAMCAIGNHYEGACGELVRKYSKVDAKEWPGSIGFLCHALDSNLESGTSILIASTFVF
jgi:hypothetical protein